jgi:hypothetical protein
MYTVSTLQRLALAGALAISSALGATSLAGAQVEPDFEPDYYQSVLTGYEIEIDGNDFVIDDVVYQEYADGENEQVYIESDVASLQVSFFDDSDSPGDTIELWIRDLGEGMDRLEIVASGTDDDVTWYFAEGVFDDTDYVYFVQVSEDIEGNVDMLESVLTLDGVLIDAIDMAQQDITIDDDEFMDDVDLDDLEEFLGGGPFRDQASELDRDRDQDDDQDTDDRGPSTTRDRERLPVDDDDDDDRDDRDDDDDDDEDDDGEGQ